MNKGRVCETCGRMLDAHTATEEGSTPEPGDISICLYCGTVYSFSKTLNSIKLSDEQFEELDEELKEKIRMYQDVLKAVRN